MNYSKMSDLVMAVSNHEQFQHEIKGKRIRKELNTLLAYENHSLTFKKYQISSSGISFYIEVQHAHRLFDFQILIDFEYPFNRPKVFYQHENSPYANCQDLLDNILNGEKWGPSTLISTILDRLPELARHVSEGSQNIQAVYQTNDYFEQEFLEKYRVDLFHVDEYEWKYMIKSTSKKVLGITRENLLKFAPDIEKPEKLKLEMVIKIKDVKEANANINGGRFKLDIVGNAQNSKAKYYFGGEEADIEKILYFMNPVQVLERRLARNKKEDYSSAEMTEMIGQYSQLIEHYSLRDPQKTKKYVNSVQELIKKSVERLAQDGKQTNLQIKIQEDIKT